MIRNLGVILRTNESKWEVLGSKWQDQIYVLEHFPWLKTQEWIGEGQKPGKQVTIKKVTTAVVQTKDYAGLSGAEAGEGGKLGSISAKHTKWN